MAISKKMMAMALWALAMALGLIGQAQAEDPRIEGLFRDLGCQEERVAGEDLRDSLERLTKERERPMAIISVLGEAGARSCALEASRLAELAAAAKAEAKAKDPAGSGEAAREERLEEPARAAEEGQRAAAAGAEEERAASAESPLAKEPSRERKSADSGMKKRADSMAKKARSPASRKRQDSGKMAGKAEPGSAEKIERLERRVEALGGEVERLRGEVERLRAQAARDGEAGAGPKAAEPKESGARSGEKKELGAAAVGAGLATGGVLGLFGSGGSIIALPALMYLLGIAAKPAIAMSLAVVGVAAAVAGARSWRRGLVDGRVALVFAAFGSAGTFAGARVGVWVPEALQLGLFALVMYAAAWKMLIGGEKGPGGGGGRRRLSWRERLLGELAREEREEEKAERALLEEEERSAPKERAEPEKGAAAKEALGKIAWHGIAVGILTGIVGVGGGFLIVPALALLSGLEMRRAIGTSLVIVAAKSFAGFAGYWGSVEIDWGILAGFTAAAIAGSLAGERLQSRIPARALKIGFAWFLVAMASYMLLKSVL